MSMVKEFKDFAMRGNVVDMAVGIIIGTAFHCVAGQRHHYAANRTALGGVNFSAFAIVLRSPR